LTVSAIQDQPKCVGVSEDTPHKLFDLRELVKKLIAVDRNTINKQIREYGRDIYPEVVVVDLNAGCGRYNGPMGQTLEGSPLIVAQVARALSLIKVNYIGIDENPECIDRMSECLKPLRNEYFDFLPFQGNNADAVAWLDEDFFKQQLIYGFVIFDPNGKPQIPAINAVREARSFRKLEHVAQYSMQLLIRQKAAAHTRNQTLTKDEYLDLHGKQFWSMQEPRKSSRKAAWFLGSDWKAFHRHIKTINMSPYKERNGNGASSLFD
jgi:hypothetical protein